MKTALAASGQTESEAIRMKEKSQVADIDRSVYDIRDKEDDAYRMQEGLTPEIIDKLSKEKDDRSGCSSSGCSSLQIYNCEMPVPDWGPSIEGLDMDHIATYVRPKSDMKNDWKDVPQDIKDTFERLGIPQAERKSLAGVGAHSTIPSSCTTMLRTRWLHRASSTPTWRAHSRVNTQTWCTSIL